VRKNDVRGSASQQQNVMRKMETQRRQKGVDGKKWLGGGYMGWQPAAREAVNRRHVELEGRTMRASIGQIQKDARSRLALVTAVMRPTGTVRHAAIVGAAAGVGVRRFDRTRRAALWRASVGMMPAAAKHRMHRQQGRHQG
jgi:hypothetical protein